MRMLLLLLPAILSAQYMSTGALVNSRTAPVGPTYTYSRQLTVDRTKAGASNLTGYPVLVSISADATFKDVAHSGHIQNTATALSGPAVTMPTDVIFTSDSGCSSKIPWEVEFYDGTAGTLIAHVKSDINGSGAGGNTSFYVCYGAASITTPQNTGSFTPANVWNTAGYVFVSHLLNGTTLNTLDSASGNAETSHTATATAGLVDGAAAFSGSQNIIYPFSSTLNVASTLSMEMWVYQTAGTAPAVLDRRNTNGFLLATASGGSEAEIFLAGASTSRDGYYGSVNFPQSAWHHLAATYDGGSEPKVYVDGTALTCVLNCGSVTTGSTNDASATLHLGETIGGAARFTGNLDEVRIASVVHSAAWITTCVANQNAPGNIGANNFIIFGSEVLN